MRPPAWGATGHALSQCCLVSVPFACHPSFTLAWAQRLIFNKTKAKQTSSIWELCGTAILLWTLQGEFFVSSTSKSYLCLISLLNCFIFSPGGNLNNNGEKSFLLHLKLEEDYRKCSDKSPNSKNSVTQIAVARKIFTKMVTTWVSSCWPDRVNQYSSGWVSVSVLMFSSVQYVSDATIRGGHHEFSEDFILIDSDFT